MVSMHETRYAPIDTNTAATASHAVNGTLSLTKEKFFCSLTQSIWYCQKNLAVAEAECNTVTGLKQVHHAATPLPLS